MKNKFKKLLSKLSKKKGRSDIPPDEDEEILDLDSTQPIIPTGPAAQPPSTDQEKNQRASLEDITGIKIVIPDEIKKLKKEPDPPLTEPAKNGESAPDLADITGINIPIPPSTELEEEIEIREEQEETDLFELDNDKDFLAEEEKVSVDISEEIVIEGPEKEDLAEVIPQPPASDDIPDELPLPKVETPSNLSGIKETFAGLRSKIAGNQKIKTLLTRTVRKSNILKSKILKTRGGARLFSWLDKFNFSSFNQKILAPDARPQIQRLFLFCFYITCAYQSGKIIALLFRRTTGVSPRTIELRPIHRPSYAASKYQDILSKNLFNVPIDAKTQPPKPKKISKQEVKKLCTVSQTKSRLPIKLVNTIVLHDSIKSVASVQVRSKSTLETLREGETIPRMAKIGKIDRFEVVFRNLENGNCEKIISKNKTPTKRLNVLDPIAGKKLMDKNRPKGIKNSENKFTIDKKLLKKQLSNINEVLTQARGTQIDNPDGSICFKISEIEPGSIYTHLGIQNSDTICKIDGNKITNTTEVFNMFSKLQNMDEMQITINRNGSETDLDYTFTDM